LLQYPQDIVDVKQLIKRFPVSAHEFDQALMSSQQKAKGAALPPPSSAPSVRPDMVRKLVAHLRQYPQDIVDAKRLIKRLQVSADEFHHALLHVDH
jgi:hypothetical protein